MAAWCPMHRNSKCSNEQCQWWVRDKHGCAVVVIARSLSREDVAEKELQRANIDYITEMMRDRRLQEAAEDGTPL